MTRKHRVPRTRGGGRYTEAQYRAILRSCIRQKFTRWPVRSDVKMEGRRLKAKRKKGRHKFEYECGNCYEWFQEKEIQIDHIEPAGGFQTPEEFGRWAFAILCEQDNLGKICIPCHKVKTKAENEARKLLKRQATCYNDG